MDALPRLIARLNTGKLAFIAFLAGALSVLAMRFAVRPRTASMTFGYFRAEILAALTNGVTLVVVAGIIMYEAIERHW